jgi:hypothetical protein
MESGWLPIKWLPVDDQDGNKNKLLQCISQCADHSKPGLCHGAVLIEAVADSWVLRLEARDINGIRQQQEDLELEIYGSSQNPSLEISWLELPDLPMLWLGRHPVWMDPKTGLQTDRPEGGILLETFGRRLRALLLQA